MGCRHGRTERSGDANARISEVHSRSHTFSYRSDNEAT